MLSQCSVCFIKTKHIQRPIFLTCCEAIACNDHITRVVQPDLETSETRAISPTRARWGTPGEIPTESGHAKCPNLKCGGSKPFFYEENCLPIVDFIKSIYFKEEEEYCLDYFVDRLTNVFANHKTNLIQEVENHRYSLMSRVQDRCDNVTNQLKDNRNTHVERLLAAAGVFLNNVDANRQTVSIKYIKTTSMFFEKMFKRDLDALKRNQNILAWDCLRNVVKIDPPSCSQRGRADSDLLVEDVVDLKGLQEKLEGDVFNRYFTDDNKWGNPCREIPIVRSAGSHVLDTQSARARPPLFIVRNLLKGRTILQIIFLGSVCYDFEDDDKNVWLVVARQHVGEVDEGGLCSGDSSRSVISCWLVVYNGFGGKSSSHFTRFKWFDFKNDQDAASFEAMPKFIDATLNTDEDERIEKHKTISMSTRTIVVFYSFENSSVVYRQALCVDLVQDSKNLTFSKLADCNTRIDAYVHSPPIKLKNGRKIKSCGIVFDKFLYITSSNYTCKNCHLFTRDKRTGTIYFVEIVDNVYFSYSVQHAFECIEMFNRNTRNLFVKMKTDKGSPIFLLGPKRISLFEDGVEAVLQNNNNNWFFENTDFKINKHTAEHQRQAFDDAVHVEPKNKKMKSDERVDKRDRTGDDVENEEEDEEEGKNVMLSFENNEMNLCVWDKHFDNVENIKVNGRMNMNGVNNGNKGCGYSILNSTKWNKNAAVVADNFLIILHEKSLGINRVPSPATNDVVVDEVCNEFLFGLHAVESTIIEKYTDNNNKAVFNSTILNLEDYCIDETVSTKTLSTSADGSLILTAGKNNSGLLLFDFF